VGSAMILEYNDRLYIEGKATYDAIIRDLDRITEKITEYVECASETESKHAPIQYNGVYLGIINQIKIV